MEFDEEFDEDLIGDGPDLVRTRAMKGVVAGLAVADHALDEFFLLNLSLMQPHRSPRQTTLRGDLVDPLSSPLYVLLSSSNDLAFYRHLGFPRAIFFSLVDRVKPHLPRHLDGDDTPAGSGRRPILDAPIMLATYLHWMRTHGSHGTTAFNLGLTESHFCKIRAAVESALVSVLRDDPHASVSWPTANEWLNIATESRLVGSSLHGLPDDARSIVCMMDCTQLRAYSRDPKLYNGYKMTYSVKNLYVSTIQGKR